MQGLAGLDLARRAAPLRQQVQDALRQAIINGRLAPGQRLTERALTETMNVSRTLIREALRQLESEGLISVIPNRGPVVRELTPGEAQELYEIRAVLEGLAARRFVEHARAELVKSLGAAVADTVAAYDSGDLVRALEAKNRFYDVLFEGAGSESLSAMLATLHARIWRWRAVGVTHPQSSPKRSQEAAKGVKRIFAAIRSRNAAAAELAARTEACRGAEELMRLLASAPPARAARA